MNNVSAATFDINHLNNKNILDVNRFDKTKIVNLIKEAYISDCDIKEFITKLLGVFPNEQLNEFSLLNEEDLLKQILCFKSQLPKHQLTVLLKAIHNEWIKAKHHITYFIPNVIDIFLEVFNFIDISKKYTTLWDKYLVVEIVSKLIILPYILIQYLKTIIISSSKVYLIAGLTLATAASFVAVYNRWLKPVPNFIKKCENLTYKIHTKQLPERQSVSNQIETITDHLLGKIPILLVGKAGVGKTALVHLLAQLNVKKKLSKELEDKTIFEVDCRALVSDLSYGHSELIKEIRDKVNGYENRIIFFFDNLDHLATNASAFQAFWQVFLDAETAPLLIATATTAGKAKIDETCDNDNSFVRRIQPINIQDVDKESLEEIINNYIDKEATDLYIPASSIDKIIDTVIDKDFIPNEGRASKAIQVLKIAIGHSRGRLDLRRKDAELRSTEKQLLNLKKKIFRSSRINQLQDELKQKQDKLNRLKSDQQLRIEKITKMNVLIQRKKVIDNEFSTWIHRISLKKEISTEDKKLFVLYNQCILEAVDMGIQECAKGVYMDEAVITLAANELEESRKMAS